MASRAVVNELSECYANCSFFDQFGNPFIPAALQYRIDDITDDIAVVPWTTISPTGITYTLTIPSAQNAMLTPTRSVQTMEVVFKITAPGGAIRYDYQQYDLVRIYNVP